METLMNYWIIALNFIDQNFTFIFAIIYWLLMIYFQYKYYKEKKKNIVLKWNINTYKTLSLSLTSLLIKFNKQNNKLIKTLKEVRKNRDKVYKKHHTQIAYYKKRYFALDLVIQDTFRDNPPFIILIKNDFYDLQKKTFKELRKMKKNLQKRNNNI